LFTSVFDKKITVKICKNPKKSQSDFWGAKKRSFLSIIPTRNSFSAFGAVSLQAASRLEARLGLLSIKKWARPDFRAFLQFEPVAFPTSTGRYSR